MRPLILASRSPQRRAILEQLGIAFTIQIPDVQELSSGPPHEVAVENAYRKASAIAAGHPESTVLGVDTLVSIGQRIWGKPAGADDAAQTLRALAGRRHAVVTGICVIAAGETRTTAATTLVQFRELDEPWISWYVASGEWRERAGGYAIQGRGAALVTAIEGDYTAVVGLPVSTLLELAPWLLPAAQLG
ncbi:MAG TPA: Maf family protein [Solirubrobacteraceae bacterium]